jgi:hypothetical protein
MAIKNIILRLEDFSESLETPKDFAKKLFSVLNPHFAEVTGHSKNPGNTRMVTVKFKTRESGLESNSFPVIVAKPDGMGRLAGLQFVGGKNLTDENKNFETIVQAHADEVRDSGTEKIRIRYITGLDPLTDYELYFQIVEKPK